MTLGRDVATASPADVVLPPAISRMTRVAVSALLAVVAAAATVEAIAAVGSDPARPDIVDFHPFYLAGTTAWTGRFAQSYDVPVMQALQRSFGGGRDVFMPFVYPPLFGLVMAPLALLPLGLAFPLFTLGTFAFFLAVVRRLAGPWFWHAVLAVSPILLIEIRVGQNGFLTAGLAGLAADLSLRRRGGLAGLAAGALAFKPQLATVLPVLFALRRDGRALAAAALTAALLTGSAVLILGRDTVPAFLSSTSVVAAFMAAGSFPLHRMTSAYAFALSLGVPARAALAIHGTVALSVVAAAAITAHRLSRVSSVDTRNPAQSYEETKQDRVGEPTRSCLGGHPSSPAPAEPRTAAGVLLMATAFVSPYFFDYDLTIFGAGLALALPGLAHRLSPRGLVLLLVGIGAVGAIDLACGMFVAPGDAGSPSLGGPAILACFGVILGATRAPRTVRPAAPAA